MLGGKVAKEYIWYESIYNTWYTKLYVVCVYIYIYFKVYNMKWNDTYEIIAQEERERIQSRTGYRAGR